MTTVVLPKLNQTGTNEWADVEDNDKAIRDVVNGQLDTGNVTAGSLLGSDLASGTVKAANLAADAKPVTWYAPFTTTNEEIRSNTSYGTLTTADKVASVILPSGGLICIAYQAMWKESVAGASRAAVFIGSNQLKGADSGSTSPVTFAAYNGGVVNKYIPLCSSPFGPVSYGSGSSDYAGDVSTGQIVGFSANGSMSIERGGVVTTLSAGSWLPMGICTMQAAAGTYDITVQFKSSSGSVTAKNRNLWVWTLGY